MTVNFLNPSLPKSMREGMLTSVVTVVTVAVHLLEKERKTRDAATVEDPVKLEGNGVAGTIDVESDRVNAFNERDQHFIEACARALVGLWSRTS
jgi:putative methionine-R-sulfoxide reductase with GAF domain